MKKLMIIAGEASGDRHAAHLVENLRQIEPETEFDFFGLTGIKMRAAKIETVCPNDDLAIMGLLEIGGALPKFWRVFRKLQAAAVERRPDAVILVDFPDFNLPLARALKKRGFKIIYYISPQLWAWRSHRLRAIRRDVDLLLTILPFEREWYARRNFNQVEFVGNPLAGEVFADKTKEEFCREYDLDSKQPIIALLPGSRGKEISKILPAMLSAATILHKSDKNLQFAVALAASRRRAEIERVINRQNLELPPILIVENETQNLLGASDAAAVASGTATLETALMNCPLVICYRVSALNWHTLRHLIDVPHYGLINLIAERRIATELIQNDLTGERLAIQLARLLNPKINSDFRQMLRETTAKLGTVNASRAAAIKILEFLKSV